MSEKQYEAGLSVDDLVAALTGGSLLPPLPFNRGEALEAVQRLLGPVS